jgi:hypothetical protein
MNLRFYSLWSINAPLDERHLCGELDLLRSAGFDGAVFHPRFYPNVPPYLSDQYMAVLSRVILYAKSIGMEFWIYDEDGWPSGTVGGQLLKRYPQVGQQWADLVAEEPAESLGSFEFARRRWHLARRRGAGVDYLNPDLAAHFLEMTHERYRLGLESAAFEHVTTFFCDEPEFGLGHAYEHLSPPGSIPWTVWLPELYRSRYGQTIDEILPLLFFSGDGDREARVRFWELLTDRFCEAFVEPVNRWCQQHGKRFTAHIKGEEHPLFQVPMVGSCHQVFQHLGLPGIDALERFPSGHFFPRQVASAAQQFGNGDCMVEAFGGAGWGAGPGDLEEYLRWLVGHGINHLVLHLFQSNLSTHAIHDWPASIPAHVNWRDIFPLLIERVRNFAKSVDPVADTLIIAPYRGIMEVYEPRELLQTNIHNASTYPDTPAGRINREFLKLIDRAHQSGSAYHVCDERSVEQHGRFDSGQLRLGNCLYRSVIVADGAKLIDAAKRLVVGLGMATISEPVRIATTSPPPILCETKWKFVSGVVNSLVLEAAVVDGSNFLAIFEASYAVELQIAFADPVAGAMLNGVTLGPNLRGLCEAGVNEIRFTCPTSVPFIALHGKFTVLSRTRFVAGPNGTVMTEGTFRIKPPHTAQPADLIATGYPFCREPLTVQSELEYTIAATEIRLIGVRADCAHVTIDGIDCGWCWGPDWSVRLPTVAIPGRHVIEVRLIASTFNFYGPHHHIDGDRHIVSPMQYEYVKNFADRPDAPASTRTKSWHFKPVGIDDRLGLLAIPDRGR